MDSRLAHEVRQAQLAATQRLTAPQRLEAFLQHCQLMTTLHRAAQRGSPDPARQAGA